MSELTAQNRQLWRAGTAVLITLVTALGVTLQSAHADLLATIDQMRISEGGVRVMTEVKLFESGELKSQRLYEVFAGSERRSLVLFRSEAEAGQKVLMLDDQYYLFMPNSRRQIRITPMQKLLGDAATGDISSLRWSEDYRVESQIPMDSNRLHLELSAQRHGLSYQRVELEVEQDSLIPLAATFYLPSGRVAKTATFEMVEEDAGPRLRAMTLHDRIQTRQITEVSYLSVEPWEIPERWFNPAFLLRNNL
ncbi:MAG: outer membrane lipoprotein-sorting protein [Saccharospirillum sp.]|nr:outer membrane lipoprotein-sorting protein [Saccharospirillum sp.]